MPRPGTVGRWNDNGERARHEHHQPRLHAEWRGERKAIERKVEMEEVAEPHQRRVKQEEGYATHLAKRYDTLPHVKHSAPHTFIERQHTRQSDQHQNHAHHAGQGYVEPRGSEKMEQRGYLGARLAEKGKENRKLEQQRGTRNEHDTESINQPLSDHRAQRLGKRHAVIARENAATRHLAQAGNDKARSIGQVNGVNQMGSPRKATQRLQRLPPAQGTLHMTPHAENQRKAHPFPPDAVAQHTGGLREVKVAIHPVEDKSTQQQGQHHLHQASMKSPTHFFSSFFHYFFILHSPFFIKKNYLCRAQK